MSKINRITLEGSFGFGIDLQRLYLNEYSWWECELVLTLGNQYITIYLNAKGLPIV
jgi:hypothetical protein